PSIAENWDQITPEPSVEDYRQFTQIRVDALNHAIRDLPEEQIRFHTCWGSWHGPHTTDIEFKHIVDLVLSINAKYYTFEAGNVRHEHEYTVWDTVQLPEGKVILPGVVSHATNVVEHPELVAQRIIRFAERVGRENVIASTDCGLGGRVHPQIANAKLETLSKGAALATEYLWGQDAVTPAGALSKTVHYPTINFGSRVPVPKALTGRSATLCRCDGVLSDDDPAVSNTAQRQAWRRKCRYTSRPDGK